MRTLIWVQHLLGIGHERRAAALARALMAAEGGEVVVARGGFPVAGTDWGGAEVIDLAPARAADASFSGVVGADGAPIDASWKKRRAADLLALHQRVRPDVVMIETWPFGRRAFRGELTALVEIAAADRPRPLIVSSVRDILVAKADPARNQAMADLARAHLDRVLVHADPRIVRLEDSLAQAASVADLLDYTGYVGSPPGRAVGGTDGAGEVLVSTGGGAVGADLLRAALAAKALSREGHRSWRLLMGGDVPEAAAVAIRAEAATMPGLVAEPARRDFPDLLARCAVSVSQAGYNTVIDLARARCPAVLVPFAQGGETEQTTRADLLAARGLAVTRAEAGLTPASLAQAIDEAATLRPDWPDLDLAGAANSARILEHRWRQARSDAAAVPPTHGNR